MTSHSIKRLALALLALLLSVPLLVLLCGALFGWNWARGPLERAVQARTGRALVIAGDLTLQLGWPSLHVQAKGVTFANPSWATQPQMLALPAARVDIDLPALFQRRWVVSSAQLTQPVVMLEVAPDGRKTWLLDAQQSDESAHVSVISLALDQGQLGLDDARNHTHLRATANAPDGAGLAFTLTGQYKNLPLEAHGSGGPVLALRDESTPYPLTLEAVIGPTHVQAKGQVNGLLTLAGLDLQLALNGGSMAELYPLLGVGLPRTESYVTTGRLLHRPGHWRYDHFVGRVGHSDVGGTVEIDMGGKRPMLRGEVLSQVLDLRDLGPALGVTATQAGSQSRVLPDMPFATDRWREFDADVTLRAARFLRHEALPLDRLVAHLQMADGVLALDPLDFAAAGGHMKAQIHLDGRPAEIQARAKVQVRQLQLPLLFPALTTPQASVGQLNGDIDLTGQGRSVGSILGSANGRMLLRVERGQISRLLMEQMGLHLLEILQLSVGGDQPVTLNCAVADFSVKHGRMTANTLALDTAVSTLTGTGQIDLAQETLDLTLMPRTRSTSLIALRSPIHVGGTLGAPQINLDKTRVLARAGGAVALGLLNPLLALAPLVETGPGSASVCGPQR